MGLKLSAVWALMVAFDRPLPADFEGVRLSVGGPGGPASFEGAPWLREAEGIPGATNSLG